jgi:FkbM family methyltransferase
LDKITLYLIKILKRLHLLGHFNFVITRAINGVKVKIPFINGIGLQNLILNADWLDALILAFIHDDNSIFIDVGVNIGQTLLRVKTIKPKIKYIGFEPNSTCSSYSQHLIKINSFSDCTIQNCALFNNTGILILEKTWIDDARASVIFPLRPNYFTDKENVIALDYDTFYLNKIISFVKIDVEGAELDVLLGMKKSLIKYQPIIVCEVLDSHDPSVFDFTQARALQLSEFLKSLNYSIIQLETRKSKYSIISFNKLDSIVIRQWTFKSCDFNDYIFCPTSKEQEVLINLSRICN